MDTFNIESEAKQYIRELELELQRTRESLQATVEELETSNEELQASNEELLASNEELQSTNEQLHSVNEELYSVNAEHELKIDELNRISSDLRNLIQSTDTATIFLDENLCLRLFTPEATEIFSLQLQDLGRDLRHFKPSIPDDSLVEDTLQVLSLGNQVGRHLTTRDDRSFLRRCSPFSDADNNARGVVINYIETTQATRTSRVLDESETLFEGILRSAPNPILVLDAKQVVLIANQQAETLFGASTGGLIGSRIERLLSQQSLPKPMQLELIVGPESDMPEQPALAPQFEGTRLDGRRFPMEISRRVLKFNDRTLVVLAITDLSQRNLIDEAREHALIAAQRLANTRSQFVANMSHELRTPLNSILGMAEIGLLDKHKASPARLRDCLVRIQDRGQHLLNVINDVLDFAKIDSGKLEVNKEPTIVSQILERCLDNVRPMAEQKGLDLQDDLDAVVPLVLSTDPLLVQQIVINLLSNALKFTRQGYVRLTARVHKEQLRLEVKDSGSGIKDVDIQRIFHPFEQGDGSLTREQGGTGLGLPISSAMAELLGGQLDVETAPDEGSTFTLLLPCVEAEAPQSPALVELRADLDGVRLLLAEDDGLNAMTTVELLEELGAKVRVFPNGKELVEHVRSGGAADCDLILMDIQMPVMNGYEATRAVRELAPELPVVGLTAHAFSDAKDRCLAAGMVAHVTKPVVFPHLVDTIKQHITSAGDAPEDSGS